MVVIDVASLRLRRLRSKSCDVKSIDRLMQSCKTRSRRRMMIDEVGFRIADCVLLGLVVYGTTHPAGEPTITIEGHVVPYRLVQVWNKHASGRQTVVAYFDPDSQIDFVEWVTVAKANEILAYQSAHKRR